jgi:hypothetical protein
MSLLTFWSSFWSLFVANAILLTLPLHSGYLLILRFGCSGGFGMEFAVCSYGVLMNEWPSREATAYVRNGYFVMDTSEKLELVTKSGKEFGCAVDSIIRDGYR